MIKKVAGGYKVLSEKGKNLGGPYKTKKEAETSRIFQARQRLKRVRFRRRCPANRRLETSALKLKWLWVRGERLAKLPEIVFVHHRGSGIHKGRNRRRRSALPVLIFVHRVVV